MTLPVSGPISLSMIEGEFGGAAPTAISEYYGVDDGVPTSGIISLSQFYGTSAIPPPTHTIVPARWDCYEDVCSGFNLLADHGSVTPDSVVNCDLLYAVYVGTDSQEPTDVVMRYNNDQECRNKVFKVQIPGGPVREIGTLEQNGDYLLAHSGNDELNAELKSYFNDNLGNSVGISFFIDV